MKIKSSAPNAEIALSDEAAVTSGAFEENVAFASLSASLAEIRKLKGVIGYILRSDTSAIVDLSESDKLTQFATLSYQIHNSSVEVAKEFDLGQPESVLVEGGNVKVLSMSLGENKISVFMEKSAGHQWIIKRILL